MTEDTLHILMLTFFQILTETDALLKSVNANLSEKTSEDEEIDLCSFTDLAVGSVINTVICGYRFTIDVSRTLSIITIVF